MKTEKLQFVGETAVVVKGVGPVAPKAEVDVPVALVASLLGDGRWVRVTAKKAGAAKEAHDGTE